MRNGGMVSGKVPWFSSWLEPRKLLWQAVPHVIGLDGRLMPRKAIKTREESDDKFWDFTRQFFFGLWGFRQRPYPLGKPIDVAQAIGGGWYYKDRLLRTRGPCELITLKTAWGGGIIDKNTFIWGEDMDEWAPIHMIYGMERAIATWEDFSGFGTSLQLCLKIPLPCLVHGLNSGLILPFSPGVVFWLAKWFLAKFLQVHIQVDLLVGDPSLAGRLPSHTFHRRMVQSWLPPPADFFKMNVGGAVRNDGLAGGIGGILRDSNSYTLATFSDSVGPGPPPLAELKAIKKGIDFFISSFWASKGRLIIESDCKTAVDWILLPNTAPSFFSSLVLEIGSLALARAVIVRLIPRGCNWEADKLAKEGIGLVAAATAFLHKLQKGIPPCVPLKGHEDKTYKQLQEEAIESKRRRRKPAKVIPGLRPWEVLSVEQAMDDITYGGEWYREPLGTYHTGPPYIRHWNKDVKVGTIPGFDRIMEKIEADSDARDARRKAAREAQKKAELEAIYGRRENYP
ncbi:Detected protein of confused Function [Hibiscus syriacus]|uniref:Detected protein of confused Function n=1 Tax=Hibiscus syriacus TaxID=106335 RepID=A0A6A3B5X8_HIBSY|nr:Detected protein of confused Function [Hibiscus syriacus]